MGHPLYPEATELLIMADGGGSNASRSRLWKVELQRLADDIRLTLRICHFPPGTSKWNKIEHRLFSHISINWRGRPLTSLDLVVRLIGATTSASGLIVKADLDRGQYPTGLKVTDDELARVRCQPTLSRMTLDYTRVFSLPTLAGFCVLSLPTAVCMAFVIVRAADGRGMQFTLGIYGSEKSKTPNQPAFGG